MNNFFKWLFRIKKIPPSLNKSGMDNSSSQEQLGDKEINEVIVQYANSMNGQLRGPMGKVAIDQNLETLI